ncbi:MAG: FAD-dependent oxidoreductase, partial [Kiritimatiellia bacterium]|nr:FAD-dependent oxidoreductase [Kiritimatiellia bacterium]
FHLGAKVEAIEENAVVFQAGADRQRAPWTRVLVATGRSVNVNDLGLEQTGVDFDRRGIKVDDRCATNVPGIWAVGDVTGRGWLAHSASRMGEVVVANLLGRRDRMRFDAIPSVVYTTPEVASVGLTQAEAKARGIEVLIGKFPLQANGRFLAEHEGEKGLVKVIVEKTSRRLLGVHQIGGVCSESIWGAAAAIESELRIEEMKEIVFPHPTTSEALRDAVWGIKT